MRSNRSGRAALAVLLISGLAFASGAVAADWGPIRIAHETIQPGEHKKFTYLGDRTFEGGFVDFRVYVARGHAPGPTLCVTSAIHGDEVNSIEIARRTFASVDPAKLAGTLVVLPAINATGFRTLNRYMPDRRDLNRFFPGSKKGSVAAIVADEVFDGVVRRCSHLVDLHTGSNLRSNMPQIRVDPDLPEAVALARAFGVGVVIEGAGPAGSLRREACRAGVAAILYEAGPPLVFLEPEIERGVRGVQNVMAHLGMIALGEKRSRSTRLTRSFWQRVPLEQGGIYLPVVGLGERVEPGQLLATIADPVSDAVHSILAREAGVVIGMALPQIVLSGYGLFHIGEVAHD
jgi:predicted deacylase